jgi:hypothetical protein
VPIAEADNLRANAASGGSQHLTAVANGYGRPAGCYQQTYEFHNFTSPRQQLGVSDLRNVRVEI